MPSVAFLVPGRIETRTGGSIYDRRMTEGLRQRGWSVDVHELDGSFPTPTRAALAHAAGVLATIHDDGIVIIDGLALGAMPDVVEREASRVRIVGLVHLPLAADVSIDPDRATDLEGAERRALASARLVIVTGTATLAMLERYDLPRDRVIVVEPGTDPAPLARGSQGALLPVNLLSVATLNAGKGHEILLRALADVPNRNWRLTCAGSLTRDPATVDRVRAMRRSLELEDRVSFVGELDAARLSECYDGADLFVLATLQETYGMAVAEALARGLPVVCTATGAMPALVGDDAGLLVPPGNTAALAAALARAIGDAGLRTRLAEGARRVRQHLPSWEYACGSMSGALARLDSV
jgi:glycosyltransferase involved in cell wall biosynthesis